MCKMEEILTDITSPGDYEVVPDVPQAIDEASPWDSVLGKMNTEVIRLISIIDGFEHWLISHNGEHSANVSFPCLMWSGWCWVNHVFIRDMRESICHTIVLPTDVDNIHLINSCHQSCHMDKSHWVLKFSSVLWSVYRVNLVPKRSDHYFLRALITASSSFSWIG